MEQFITKTLRIERITLVGPASEKKAVYVWMKQNGYWPVKSGPYSDVDMCPRVDVDRFLIVAERWIEDDAATIPRAAVAAALAELRAEIAGDCNESVALFGNGGGHVTKVNECLRMLNRLDATISKLGLEVTK